VLTATAAVLGLASLVTVPPVAAQSHDDAHHPSATARTVAQATAPDFGSAPSGEVPILYNDRHVYAKPDELKQSRTLAALVRGNTILVPLRSMFEQMGATVSYDPSTKTADVSKPGSDVKVTVGKPEVIINGESRPLDVPPEIYKGAVVVPVRVLSEAMGAYVLWVPNKCDADKPKCAGTTVVRYIPPATPAPAPPPPPPPPPTPPPTPTPSPTPAPTRAYEGFVAGDFLFAGKVYDEFSAGNTEQNSYRLHGAYEFPLFGLPWMLAGEYDSINYQHQASGTFPNGNTVANYLLANGINSIPGTLACPVNGEPGCVTTIGGGGSTWVTPFQVQTQTLEGRFGLKVIDPRIYIAVGYMDRSNNHGYPGLGGVGFGVQKLPDLQNSFSFQGAVFYYPSIKGNYTDPFGNAYSLAYNALRYDVGVTYRITHFPVYLEAGFTGERDTNKTNAPSNWSANSIYAGLGFKFF
jgi:hypothetical protein